MGEREAGDLGWDPLKLSRREGYDAKKVKCWDSETSMKCSLSHQLCVRSTSIKQSSLESCAEIVLA
eukprot:2251235-Amphidinium_carterae.1